jgi:hypothetical protein
MYAQSNNFFLRVMFLLFDYFESLRVHWTQSVFFMFMHNFSKFYFDVMNVQRTESAMRVEKRASLHVLAIRLMI